MTLQAATPFIRWLYSLALLSVLVQTCSLGISSAVGMAYGVGCLSGIPIFSILISAALVYRIVQVMRLQNSLDMLISGRAVWILRAGGVLLMCVGLGATLLLLFIRPLTLIIFPNPGDNGIAFFVVGVVLYPFAGAGWFGIGAFELARYMGNRQPG